MFASGAGGTGGANWPGGSGWPGEEGGASSAPPAMRKKPNTQEINSIIADTLKDIVAYSALNQAPLSNGTKQTMVEFVRKRTKNMAQEVSNSEEVCKAISEGAKRGAEAGFLQGQHGLAVDGAIDYKVLSDWQGDQSIVGGIMEVAKTNCKLAMDEVQERITEIRQEYDGANAHEKSNMQNKPQELASGLNQLQQALAEKDPR